MLFLNRVEASPERRRSDTPARTDGTRSPGSRPRTGWRPLAAGLLALGIEPENRIGIASSTRLEWILADLAMMCAGAATTTVYPSTNGDDTAYILADSEARVVFAEDDTQVEKITEHRGDLPNLQRSWCSRNPATATG